MKEIAILLDEHNGRTRAVLVRLKARVARRRGRWQRRRSQQRHVGHADGREVTAIS